MGEREGTHAFFIKTFSSRSESFSVRESAAHGKSSSTVLVLVLTLFHSSKKSRTFPAELKNIFQNFLSLSLCLCVLMCGFQLKRSEYIMWKLGAQFLSAFRLHLHGITHENGNSFLLVSETQQTHCDAIQSVTEINSESNHQYSMFASNVRSYNRKLTTLQNARRDFFREVFFGIPLWPQICYRRRRKIVCVVKGAFCFC